MKENQNFRVGDRVRILPGPRRQLWGEFGTITEPGITPYSWRVRPDDWPHLDLVFFESELESLSSASTSTRKEGESHVRE